MFSSTKWLMMASGTWKLDLPQNLRLPYKIYEFLTRSIFVWTFVTINVCFVQNIGIDYDKAMTILAIAVNITCCAIKLLICMGRKTVLLINIAFKDNFEGNGDGRKVSRILRKHYRQVRNFNLFTFTYTYIMAFLFSVYGGFMEYHNFQTSHPNATEKPEYLIIMWTPFDAQKHFELVLTIQMLVCVSAGAGNCSSMTLFNTLMVYVVVKLRILQHKFKNFNVYFVETANGFVRAKMPPEEAERNLKQLIREHQNLIRFVRDLDDRIKNGILIEYTFTSLMLASMLLQILNGYRLILYCPYFVLLTFQLFLLSYNAEEISYQSSEIGKKIYESDWYFHGADVKWLILMILMRSRRELCLNIGPFGPNSLKAAVSRLKLGYSYTSLISGNRA
ncbi:odorant receptor 10-like [Euwallacea fornicatus]|uniref:odorant receptor 10-like n=1 Tax=Euwallacea fornicatus TaxID=995702 RepID=UPI00338DC62C